MLLKIRWRGKKASEPRWAGLRSLGPAQAARALLAPNFPALLAECVPESRERRCSRCLRSGRLLEVRPSSVRESLVEAVSPEVLEFRRGALELGRQELGCCAEEDRAERAGAWRASTARTHPSRQASGRRMGGE